MSVCQTAGERPLHLATGLERFGGSDASAIVNLLQGIDRRMPARTTRPTLAV